MPPMPNFPLQIDPALRRYPVRTGELLLAWDSADELVLDHLRENAATLLAPGKKVLIFGDGFGALTRALADYAPTTYSDSYLAHRAIESNGAGGARAISRLAELRGPFDLVVARIPKNLSFFEDTLAHVAAACAPDAKLVAGYMLKHRTNGAFDLLGKYFGATTTSLARKKARLIFATLERASTPSPYPLAVAMPGFERPFVNHSNVFSRERVDIGTRFFLQYLPGPGATSILDLGCGNGVVGIAAKRANPGARVIFTDESRMAIDSAEANYRANFPAASADAAFLWTNGYADGKPGVVDLVLCNPPFHQGTTIGDFVAREMFADAFRVLAPGGRLRVIGNTHLRYPFALRNLFGNATVVATNAKFQIVDAVKSP